MSDDRGWVRVMRWILYGVTLPWTVVVGYGWVFLATGLFLARGVRMEEYGLMTAEWRPWVAQRWRYSTTLGRGIIYTPGRRRAAVSSPELTSTEIHERRHVYQVEDLMMLSLVLGLIVGIGTGDWLMGFLLWCSGGAWQLPNFLTAAMRGGDAYRDSEHERAAYGRID